MNLFMVPKVKKEKGEKDEESLSQKEDELSEKDKKSDIQFMAIPGYGVEEYQFLIEGNGEITLDFESRKAKSISASVKL